MPEEIKIVSIKRWDNGKIIYSGNFKTVKECLADGVTKNVSFDYAKLNNAKLNGAELNGAELNYAELNNAELNNAKLHYAKLNGAELNGAKLHYAKLNGAELNGAELNGAKLHYAKLNGAELNGAELNGAELNNAELNGAELNGAIFDFSSYPLHCGSLRVRNARRLFCQLAYHQLTFLDIDDDDINELINYELFKKVANKFCEYRADLELIT